MLKFSVCVCCLFVRLDYPLTKKVIKNLTSLLKTSLFIEPQKNKIQNLTVKREKPSTPPTMLRSSFTASIFRSKSVHSESSHKHSKLNSKNKKKFEKSNIHDSAKLNTSVISVSPSSTYVKINGTAFTNIDESSHHINKPPPEGYLVWSEFCKMPNLDPYLPEVMKNFRRQKYKPCKLLDPLTKVEFNGTSKRYTLSIDEDVIPGYSKKGKVDCCYQSIIRNGTGTKADSEVR